MCWERITVDSRVCQIRFDPLFRLCPVFNSKIIVYRAKRFDVVCQTFDLFLYATLVLYLSCKGIKKALQGVCRAFAIYAHGRIICMGFS